ncbi:ferritin-like domain-containing protein [uncultured Oxalicibacterium sp.]|uniref:ferritin-like domain-containing protein n=1 Tax=uncultured Oxalicibacterium sp. TaxID=1168540 RepID=UPI0025E1B485|nr:ferritin-like domain-containing protein [uncultured Oxalicibacterium sp.]
MALPFKELREAALCLLVECDPGIKAGQTIALAKAWAEGGITLDTVAQLLPSAPIPGRPAHPILLPPKDVARRAMHTPEGRAIAIHALTHIEFNAINLALDAIWRFADMPHDYYADWLKVAAEEALHFSLLAAHLQRLGYAYGDFSAHNSLWEMTEKTVGDVLARMALVPRTMEARGLDASPPMRAKLAQAGDAEAAAILDIILRDEIGHVAVGNRWYAFLCAQRGLEPVSTYRQLSRHYKAPIVRGPFNLAARRAAGFSEADLADLLSAAQS